MRLAVHEECEEFQKSRVTPPTGAVRAKRLGIIPLERSLCGLPQFLAGIERVTAQLGNPACTPGEELRRPSRCHADRWPIDEREIKFVHHQTFACQTLAVPCVESRGECIGEIASWVALFAAPNDMCPNGDVGACDISPQDIQSLMPTIHLHVVLRLEACAA